MNQKKIGALKTAFRKKMKEKKVKTTIARDNRVIKFVYSGFLRDETFAIYAEFKNNVMILKPSHYMLKINYFIEALDEFWLPLAQEMNLDAIMVDKLDDKIKKELEKRKYLKLNEVFPEDAWKKYVDHRISTSAYVYALHQERLEKTLEYYLVFRQCLAALKEEDITFTYKFQNAEETLVAYYYQGVKSTLPFAIYQGNFIFKEEIVSTTTEELKRNTENYFKKIYDKQKLKNIFIYPTIHFENSMIKYITTNTESIQTILAYLKTMYQPQEIEKYFAANPKNIKLEKYTSSKRQEIKIFSFMDVYFVLTGNQDVFFLKEDAEKAKETFREKIVELAKKESQELLSSFDEKCQL